MSADFGYHHCNMKTIAITIEVAMLRSLDRLVGTGSSRSRLVRDAIADYLARESKRRQETAERKIWDRHHARLERQARALVAEQAEP